MTIDLYPLFIDIDDDNDNDNNITPIIYPSLSLSLRLCIPYSHYCLSTMIITICTTKSKMIWEVPFIAYPHDTTIKLSSFVN